jgi:hypothetical protein
VTLIDELFGEYDFAERHEVRVASPRAALDAVKAVTPREMPLLRVLFALRSGPAVVVRGRGLPRAKDRPLVEQMVEFGFVPLAERDDELVFGFVGQPWRVLGGSMPRLTRDDWLAFDSPGYVKAVMNFRAAESVLETETRIRATDEASRRRFRRYWLVIRPFSGLIRRVWLRASARRAEA